MSLNTCARRCARSASRPRAMRRARGSCPYEHAPAPELGNAGRPTAADTPRPAGDRGCDARDGGGRRGPRAGDPRGRSDRRARARRPRAWPLRTPARSLPLGEAQAPASGARVQPTRVVPTKHPLGLDEVLTRFPMLRQSDLSDFDDCELSTLFAMRYERGGWSTSPQARGTIEHRVFAECLRTMQRQDSEAIAPEDAHTILIEKLRQHDVAPEERVRVPLRELPVMEWTVRKWAKDNRFTIRNLIDVERRLATTVTYRVPETG